MKEAKDKAPKVSPLGGNREPKQNGPEIKENRNPLDPQHNNDEEGDRGEETETPDLPSREKEQPYIGDNPDETRKESPKM